MWINILNVSRARQTILIAQGEREKRKLTITIFIEKENQHVKDNHNIYQATLLTLDRLANHNFYC